MIDTSAWCVLRTDDNGTTSIVARDLSEHEAVMLEKRMTALGHKQFYEAILQEHMEKRSITR